MDGFTQVQLDEQSSFATTMQTPWGRYRWLRLPYGISSALDGLPGVFRIADDILIYGLGDSPEEAEVSHDKHLSLLMQRVVERNMKLNPAKVQFKLKGIGFMGHIITQDGVQPELKKV